MTTELRNVVIIGASAAGADLTRRLGNKLPLTHRLVLIDANDYGFWPLAALRAAVVPGWEDKAFKSLAGFFPSGSRHVLLSKTKVIELGNGFVKVDAVHHELGLAQEIGFDIAVLALGSSYGFPMRAKSNTLVDAKRALIEAQQALKTQTNIVIVGGGPVGVEYAGEIISQYPNKNITIIQGSHRLLNESVPLKLSLKLQRELESGGVKIVFGERVERSVAEAGKGTVVLKDGTLIEADLIINSSGVTPNTALVSHVDLGAVDAAGLIKVDKNLRVISSNNDSFFSESNYFAIGDCCSSPGGAKAHKAGNDAAGVSINILATLFDQPLVAVAPPMDAWLISIGPSSGAGHLPWWGLVGRWLTSFKSKGLLVSIFAKLYA